MDYHALYRYMRLLLSPYYAIEDWRVETCWVCGGGGGRERGGGRTTPSHMLTAATIVKVTKFIIVIYSIP